MMQIRKFKKKYFFVFFHLISIKVVSTGCNKSFSAAICLILRMSFIISLFVLPSCPLKHEKSICNLQSGSVVSSLFDVTHSSSFLATILSPFGVFFKIWWHNVRSNAVSPNDIKQIRVQKNILLLLWKTHPKDRFVLSLL